MVTPVLSPSDRDRITAAVRAAEARTSAEIVVVVETASCEEADATIALIAAGGVAIAAAGPLDWLGLRLEAIVIGQALVFALLAALASSSHVRRALRVGRIAAHRAAHRAAEQAFDDLGLGRTLGRTGVLLHVAAADRRVEVIADFGVHDAVAPETWREEVALVVEAAREGRLADGIVAAVARCGEALADALPPQPGVGDELPDEPIVR
ncbi:TPM domain-containing protein [Methylopila henanensis]|uniref:TPM domain-containing protein n=1 Tax=Methylopila henanensis TaxID=873516 RepID=A0ABW4K9N5_9HYPH